MKKDYQGIFGHKSDNGECTAINHSAYQNSPQAQNEGGDRADDKATHSDG